MGVLWPATPVEAQSPPHLAIQSAGSQQLSLDLSGTAGEMYEIDASSNLVDWTVLLTTNSPTSDVVVTTTEGGSAGEFYRAVDLGPVGGSPSAVFTLLWPGSSGSSGLSPQGLTIDGSVVFVVENTSGKTVTNQVVNLLSNTNQATVDWSLANGSYTAVADAFPEPNGVGVPFAEARFSFTVTGGAPVTQTFTLADSAITNLTITPANATMAVGGSLQLNATAFDASNEVVFVASQSGALTWSSATLPIATVDYTGKLTGVAPGLATIQVALTTNLAITAYATVTDLFEIVGLTITNVPAFQPVYVGVGDETNLTVIATNANGEHVTLATSAMVWSSSAVSNAAVDGTGSSGLLIGVAPGLAAITASNKYALVAPATTTANVTIGGPGSVADGVPPPTNGYIITDLGTLQNNPGYLSSMPFSLNDYGHVAGTTWQSVSPTNNTTTPQAFIWKTSLNGVMTVLPDIGGGQAGAMSINSGDEVVGWSLKSNTVSSTKQYMQAVLWRSDKAHDLDSSTYLPAPTSPPWPPVSPPGYYNTANLSEAFYINDEGQVVGTAADDTTNSIPWSSEFLLDLEQTNVTYLWASIDFPSEPFPSPETINDAGEMAGGLFLFNGITASYAYAFIGQVGQITSAQVPELANLPGYYSGFAWSINNLNQTAGACSESASVISQFSQPRAVIWQNGQANLNGSGQATDLGTNGYYSRALCINDLGTVVGDSWPGVDNEYTGSHAVLWQGTNMFDLNACIPTNSGWVLDVASGINNKGQIIGQGTVTNGIGYHSFLLTPNN